MKYMFIATPKGSKEEIRLLLNKSFTDQYEADKWINTYICLDDFETIRSEAIPSKRYKVAYNRISPSYSIVNAANEDEAKEKVTMALENEGCPGWEFLMVKEDK